MDFFQNLGDAILVFFAAFIFMASLFAVIMIATDLFRDKELGGWGKAIWLVCLVFLPLLTALVYLIARGDGMSERQARGVADNQKAAEAYIQNVAGTSPSDEIAKAKSLLEAGTISEEEFAGLKAHALSGKS